jgi:multidrug resistance efflux pump
MLGHARVLAPFNGVITRKVVDVGDLAIPGRPLVEIEDPAQLRFEADVPEGLIDPIQTGAQMMIRIASRTNLVAGVVVEMAPAAEAVSRTYRVTLDIPVLPGFRCPPNRLRFLMCHPPRFSKEVNSSMWS